jgi:hypothetical protein
MEQFTFLIVFLGFAAFFMVRLHHRNNLLDGILLIVTICVGAAFYLFQYGSLGSFSIKALSAEASFIKEKKDQVSQDADAVHQTATEIAALKQNVDNQAQEISAILTELKAAKSDTTEVRKNLFGVKGDVLRVERDLLEIEYLSNQGRNIFPNPYNDRIIAKINDILVVAIPDPNERGPFVQELQSYAQTHSAFPPAPAPQGH